MMKKMCRLIAAVAVPLVCFGMWGCMGCSDDKVIDSGTSIGRHFYMVNDSIIMLDFFNWETVEFYSSYIQGRDEETHVTGKFALIVNINRDSVYRRIDFPETITTNFLDQVMDGLAFYFTPGEEDHFDIVMLAGWRFPDGKALSYMNRASDFIDSTDYLIESQNGLLKNERILSIHDGASNVEFRSRQFYICNFSENLFAKWIPVGESAWIADCKDVQWTEEKFRCLIEKDGYVHVLNENRESLDSLKVAGCGIDRCYSFGIRFYGGYIGVGHPIHKMYEDGKISDEPLFEIYFENDKAIIYSSSGDTIYYSGENL